MFRADNHSCVLNALLELTGALQNDMHSNNTHSIVDMWPIKAASGWTVITPRHALLLVSSSVPRSAQQARAKSQQRQSTGLTATSQ